MNWQLMCPPVVRLIQCYLAPAEGQQIVHLLNLLKMPPNVVTAAIRHVHERASTFHATGILIPDLRKRFGSPWPEEKTIRMLPLHATNYHTNTFLYFFSIFYSHPGRQIHSMQGIQLNGHGTQLSASSQKKN